MAKKRNAAEDAAATARLYARGQGGAVAAPGDPWISTPKVTGYRPCACRDCMETAIGLPGAFCHDCEASGCEADSECQAPGAYGVSED